ncbi:MAG: COX15/CtaA family protein [Dehalococcoidia bacterium]
MTASTISHMTGLDTGLALRRIGWLALATAAVTAGLITYGAWVRVSGSGLGCPDWPLCNGGILPGEERAAAIEYGHRLLAGLTMIMVAVLGVWGFRRRREAPLAAAFLVGAAVLILAQAALGGIAVLADLPGAIRLAHLAMGMTILGLLTFGGLNALSRDWELPRVRVSPLPLALVGAGTIMIGGSIVATQTSFGCLDLPVCDGGASTMATWLHGLHRTLGLVLVAGVAAMAWTVRRQGGSRPLLAVLGVSAALVAAQLGIGVVSVAATFPSELRVLHVALATLTWWSLAGFWALAVLSAKESAGATGRI